ncbi:hypothetical protein C8J56DRAFT_1047199 [Mycena floridula]|nr:hypothetical protein C8J56DRAFT_1047199 [Mycena floridula]
MDAFYTLSHHILLKNPDSSWTTSALIWVVRIVTLSLLLRTYIVPWLLSIVLKHFRIRSISLRSLRGLYIRRGNLTCRAERVSYVWPSMSDSGRFTVKIEGLNLEIFKFSGPPVAHRMHKRALTFANLSEFQYRSWDLFWSIVSLFDPVLRPILRNLIVGALRLVIHRMPNALTIEFHNTSLSFPGTPRAHLKSGDIVINASLELKTVQAAPLPQASESLHPPRRSYSMAAWRTRMRNGLARSLGRALDNTTGMAQISLNLRDFAGVIRSAEQQDTPVFSIPGGISLNVSLPFDPKGGIGAHSLKTHLQIGECSSEISELMVFLDLFRPPKPPAPSSPAPSSPDTPLSTFIFPNSPPPSSLFPNTPMSPLLEAISGIMSYLESFTVRIAALKFSSSHGMGSADETYLAAIQHVSIKVGLSNAKENQLHRRWLGCPEQTDHLTPEIYSTIVSVRQMTLDRTSGAKLRLATVGKVEVQLLGIQWPSPWLKPLPFFGGDANAAIAIVRVMVEAIDMQERTESFYKLADRLSSQASPSVPSHASKIPTTSFHL